MTQFINAVSHMCNCTMWALVFLLEATFFYVVFSYPSMITDIAQLSWMLASVPVFLPAVALFAFGMPFAKEQTW